MVFEEKQLLASKWSRFQYYASLVRDIEISISCLRLLGEGFENGFALHPNTLLQIHTAAIANRTCILPRLKRLVVTSFGESACERVGFLIPDDVEELQLSLSQESANTLDLVLHRLSYCSRLAELCISVDRDDWNHSSPVVEALAQMLAVMPRLKSLRLPTDLVFNPRVWEVAKKLDSLETLGMPDDSSASRMAIPQVNHLELSNGLASVTTLEVRASCVELEKLLETEITAPIDSLLVRVFDATSLAQVSLLTMHIGESLPNLHSLELFLDFSSISLNASALMPLTKLKYIIDLHISSDAVSQLSDKDYETLTASLPELKSLRLCPDPVDEPHSRPTIVALHHIARNCRSIKTIAIHIDTTIRTLAYLTAELTPFSKSLEEISFGLSPVSDEVQVAQQLLLLFMSSYPVLLDYREGLTRSGRTDESETLRRCYQAARIRWGNVMNEVSKLRPFVDAVREGVKTEMALLKAIVDAQEDKVNRLENAMATMQNAVDTLKKRIEELEGP